MYTVLEEIYEGGSAKRVSAIDTGRGGTKTLYY